MAPTATADWSEPGTEQCKVCKVAYYRAMEGRGPVCSQCYGTLAHHVWMVKKYDEIYKGSAIPLLKPSQL